MQDRNKSCLYKNKIEIIKPYKIIFPIGCPSAGKTTLIRALFLKGISRNIIPLFWIDEKTNQQGATVIPAIIVVEYKGNLAVFSAPASQYWSKETFAISSIQVTDPLVIMEIHEQKGFNTVHKFDVVAPLLIPTIRSPSLQDMSCITAYQLAGLILQRVGLLASNLGYEKECGETKAEFDIRIPVVMTYIDQNPNIPEIDTQDLKAMLEQSLDNILLSCRIDRQIATILRMSLIPLAYVHMAFNGKIDEKEAYKILSEFYEKIAKYVPTNHISWAILNAIVNMPYAREALEIADRIYHDILNSIDIGYKMEVEKSLLKAIPPAMLVGAISEMLKKRDVVLRVYDSSKKCTKMDLPSFIAMLIKREEKKVNLTMFQEIEKKYKEINEECASRLLSYLTGIL